MAPERSVDTRIQKAMDEFKGTLDDLKSVQDPLSKKVLREIALEKLSRACDVNKAVEMRRVTVPPKFSYN